MINSNLLGSDNKNSLTTLLFLNDYPLTTGTKGTTKINTMLLR